MKRFFTLFLATVMFLSCFTMFGCAESSTETGVLRVCNCEDYIDEDLLSEFTEETGIEVVYSTYGTNENLYNELVINPNSYDLVVPSEYMIEKLAEEGRLEKLDLTKVPNYTENVSDYIDGRLEELKVKSGEYKGLSLSEFMVGYMWGTMGWVYNTENVSAEEVSSWGGVFNNPELAKKITIKDAVRDSYLVGLAMVYGEELKNTDDNDVISEILNRTEQENIDAVGEKLSSLKNMLYGFEVDSGKNDIVLGFIDAYVAWSGDAAYAIDVASGEVEDEDGSFVEGRFLRDLSYSIPEEGSNIWFDGFVMPKGSENQDEAYEFLNFISRPENVYRNMNYTGYTGMVAKGEFSLDVENEDGTVETITTSIFDEVVLGWFDESEDLLEDEGVTVDLSYFFGNDNDYTVKVSEEGLGRLIAQYPTEDIVKRCAIMSNFDSKTLKSINDMWEGVKGETFPTWLLILIAVFVVILATFVILYRNKEKIKWFKLPERKTTYAERKNLKVIKVEDIK